MFACLFFVNSYQIENDLNSFIQSFRVQQNNPLMANTNRSTYPVSSFQSQSELNFYTNPSQNLDMTGQVLRSLSPDDVQKLKYKIELGSMFFFSLKSLIKSLFFVSFRQTSC